MRRLDSLRLRIPLLALAILAASLSIATLLAYELVVNVEEQELRTSLQRERDRFEQSISVLLEQTDATLPLRDRLVEASRQYLSLNPGNAQYLRVVRVGSEADVAAGLATTLTSRSGPPELVRLITTDGGGGLPLSPLGELATVATSEGDVRSLVAPLTVDGEPVAFYQVASPADAISAQAFEALVQMLIVAGISLAVGGLLLAGVLSGALRPLERLAAAARSTELQELATRVPEPERVDEVGQLAREFNGMLERLEQAVKGQQEFMASVSHELRTPLTIARGHVETLQRLGASDPAVNETAEVVREELLRIGRLVEDLMALARADTPSFVTRHRVELQTFFDELQLRVIGLGAPNVEVHTPPAVVVEVDPNRLGQALLNLITNAIVHTPPQTRVEVGADRVGAQVALYVRDNGPGIDPAIRQHIFEPYVTGATNEGSDSAGLGMAVVKAIVDAHGGEIQLNSSASGTEVTILLGSSEHSAEPRATPLTPVAQQSPLDSSS